MTLNLPERFERRLIKLCEEEPSVSKAIVFGSRARGDHRHNSDIDLALEGNAIPLRLNTKLRDAAGLYRLDIVLISELENPKLLQEIRSEGVPVYERR